MTSRCWMSSKEYPFLVCFVIWQRSWFEGNFEIVGLVRLSLFFWWKSTTILLARSFKGQKMAYSIFGTSANGNGIMKVTRQCYRGMSWDGWIRLLFELWAEIIERELVVQLNVESSSGYQYRVQCVMVKTDDKYGSTSKDPGGGLNAKGLCVNVRDAWLCKANKKA